MNRILAVMLLLWIGLGVGCASRLTADGKPEIYNARADGEEQLARALRKAQREEKRVLLNLGANWCSDSQAMFRLLQTDRDIRQVIRRHFVPVLVDVNKRGSAPRNTNVVARFNDPLSRGIPVLLILAPEGTLLNTDSEERLADSDHEDPARVLAYLKKMEPRRPPLTGP